MLSTDTSTMTSFSSSMFRGCMVPINITNCTTEKTFLQLKRETDKARKEKFLLPVNRSTLAEMEEQLSKSREMMDIWSPWQNFTLDSEFIKEMSSHANIIKSLDKYKVTPLKDRMMKVLSCSPETKVKMDQLESALCIKPLLSSLTVSVSPPCRPDVLDGELFAPLPVRMAEEITSLGARRLVEQLANPEKFLKSLPSLPIPEWSKINSSTSKVVKKLVDPVGHFLLHGEREMIKFGQSWEENVELCKRKVYCMGVENIDRWVMVEEDIIIDSLKVLKKEGVYIDRWTVVEEQVNILSFVPVEEVTLKINSYNLVRPEQTNNSEHFKDEEREASPDSVAMISSLIVEMISTVVYLSLHSTPHLDKTPPVFWQTPPIPSLSSHPTTTPPPEISRYTPTPLPPLKSHPSTLVLVTSQTRPETLRRNLDISPETNYLDIPVSNYVHSPVTTHHIYSQVTNIDSQITNHRQLNPSPVLIHPTPTSHVLSQPIPTSPVLSHPTPDSPVLRNPTPTSTVLNHPTPTSLVLSHPTPTSPVLSHPTPTDPLLSHPTPTDPLLNHPAPTSSALSHISLTTPSNQKKAICTTPTTILMETLSTGQHDQVVSLQSPLQTAMLTSLPIPTLPATNLLIPTLPAINPHISTLTASSLPIPFPTLPVTCHPTLTVTNLPLSTIPDVTSLSIPTHLTSLAPYDPTSPIVSLTLTLPTAITSADRVDSSFQSPSQSSVVARTQSPYTDKSPISTLKPLPAPAPIVQSVPVLQFLLPWNMDWEGFMAQMVEQLLYRPRQREKLGYGGDTCTQQRLSHTQTVQPSRQSLLSKLKSSKIKLISQEKSSSFPTNNPLTSVHSSDETFSSHNQSPIHPPYPLCQPINPHIQSAHTTSSHLQATPQSVTKSPASPSNCVLIQGHLAADEALLMQLEYDYGVLVHDLPPSDQLPQLLTSPVTGVFIFWPDMLPSQSPSSCYVASCNSFTHLWFVSVECLDMYLECCKLSHWAARAGASCKLVAVTVTDSKQLAQLIASIVHSHPNRGLSMQFGESISRHENLLVNMFPCLNPYSARVILAQTKLLQFLSFDESTISSLFPWLPEAAASQISQLTSTTFHLSQFVNTSQVNQTKDNIVNQDSNIDMRGPNQIRNNMNSMKSFGNELSGEMEVDEIRDSMESRREGHIRKIEVNQTGDIMNIHRDKDIKEELLSAWEEELGKVKGRMVTCKDRDVREMDVNRILFGNEEQS